MEPAAAPPKTLGFDTGFFQRLYTGHDRARAAWNDIRAGRATGVVSCLSLFELERLGLRGALPHDVAERLVESIPAVCTVVWLGADDGAERLHRAARRAHGIGLSMADALILTSLLDAEAITIYSTDGDFMRYDGPAEIVSL